MDGGFTREVRDRARRRDVALLAVVPLVLAVLATLPRAGRVALAFSPADPTLVTAFVSHYVHLTTGHLLSNLAAYLLFAPLVYLLCLLSGDRWLFLTGFATFLVAFPFALSGLELVVGGGSVLLGFSGINAALVGLLAFTLTRYVGARFAGRVDPAYAPPAFFLAAALIAAVAVPGTVQSVGLAAAALLAAMLFVGGIGRPSDVVPRLRAAAAQPGYFELAGVAVGLFVAYPFVAFPRDPGAAGTMVNLHAHLLGFALGFIVAHVTTLVSPGIDRERQDAPRPTSA
ncbi:hypothetical protein [Halorarius halobius]|uniref:hypothetical protein n=1 Tax=Halorarius halobius TaxID=2962671 RepID=UPI0020CBFE0C|nr:hypothetical protein [Halorarius halobius]